MDFYGCHHDKKNSCSVYHYNLFRGNSKENVKSIFEKKSIMRIFIHYNKISFMLVQHIFSLLLTNYSFFTRKFSAPLSDKSAVKTTRSQP